jgi:hypothetical protein
VRRERRQSIDADGFKEWFEDYHFSDPAWFDIGGQSWSASLVWRDGPEAPPDFRYGDETVA